MKDILIIIVLAVANGVALSIEPEFELDKKVISSSSPEQGNEEGSIEN